MRAGVDGVARGVDGAKLMRGAVDGAMLTLGAVDVFGAGVMFVRGTGVGV
jgi:hypothetical protein